MVDEPEGHPLEEQEEDEGGPIKSFLEHLEDLRWVMIKSITAAGVAMLICLLGGNYVVEVLKWPLMRAPALHTPKGQTVRLTFGTNQLASFHVVSTNEPLAAIVGTNSNVRLEIVPVLAGTNLVLGLNPQPEDASAGARKNGNLGIDIVNLTPAGSFIVATKVAFYAGLVIASPFIFYYVAQFIFPALRMREKKYVYRGLGFGLGLFLTGVSFCYFVLMPIALTASAQYAEWLGFTVTQWRAEEYIGFVCKFMLGMGLGFELPVVVLTLVKLGVLNYRILASARRYVIVICFVLGAILTTPEVITQVLMAIPLLTLYEICVWVAYYWEYKEKKLQEAAEKAEGTT
jgi:sec-independent protein translocase protein TatC